MPPDSVNPSDVLADDARTASVGADRPDRHIVLDALAKLRLNPPFPETAAFLAASRGPLYEANPANPDRIVQVLADGSRVPGKFVNREFASNT